MTRFPDWTFSVHIFGSVHVDVGTGFYGEQSICTAFSDDAAPRLLQFAPWGGQQNQHMDGAESPAGY